MRFKSDRLLELIREKNVTQRQVAEAIDVSPGVLSNYLSDKKGPGYETLIKIARYFGVSTDYLLGYDERACETITVPIAGTIRGGEPLLAVREHGESVALPKDMVPSGRTFALIVKGDSMIGDQLHEGDLAIIQEDGEVEQDAIYAVAVNGDEATLKHVHFFGGYVALVPSNPDYLPTNHKPEELHFYGRLVGKYTRY